jgi:predicted nucleic acid-binding protein
VALEGEADYLVTGDEDLLVINTFQSTKIIRPKEFEDMFKSEEG